MFLLRVTTLSPASALIGTKYGSIDWKLRQKSPEIRFDVVENFLLVVDQVHLVDRDDDVRQPEQRRDVRMPPRLRQQPFPRIHQHDGQLRSGRAGHHVARVLLVARRVGDDELALRRREVAIGDVDGDALFAFGAQAVRQQREIDRADIAARPKPWSPIRADLRRRCANRTADGRSASICRRLRCRPW